MQQTVETIYTSKYEKYFFNSFVDFYFGAADDPVHMSSSQIDIDSGVSQRNDHETLVIFCRDVFNVSKADLDT